MVPVLVLLSCCMMPNELESAQFQRSESGVLVTQIYKEESYKIFIFFDAQKDDKERKKNLIFGILALN